MKIVLEGTSEEVGRMLNVLAGLPATALPRSQPTGAMPVPVDCPPALEALIKDWAADFDLTGKRHWDESASNTGPELKGEALRSLGISSSNGKVLAWVMSKGGLTHAVHEFVPDKKLARAVAGNIAQVASILFVDLAQTLEHFDPFED